MAKIVVANAKIIVTGKRSTEPRTNAMDRDIQFDNICAHHFTVQVTLLQSDYDISMYYVTR